MNNVHKREFPSEQYLANSIRPLYYHLVYVHCLIIRLCSQLLFPQAFYKIVKGELAKRVYRVLNIHFQNFKNFGNGDVQ